MATYTYAPKPGMTHLHTWVLTTADPTGDAIEIPGAADRTSQFVGGATWGAATAIWEGSLDGVTFVQLTDPQGNALSATADEIEAILENPLWIRPRLSVVGAGASVIALLLSKRT